MVNLIPSCLKFTFKYGIYIISPVVFVRPDMVAVIGDRIVTVGDSAEHVNIYSKQLRKMKSFKLRGGNEPRPRGLSTDGTHLFISDKANQSITKYTIKGKKIVESRNTFGGRCGTAIDTDKGRVYVAHESAHKIEVLDLDLNSVGLEFGEEGDQRKQFKQPCDVAVARVDDTVYVSDTGNNRIQVFSGDGEYIREFGKDHLSEPAGLCVDHNNRVLVTDHGHHRVCIFNAIGELLDTFGQNEEIKANFEDLYGIAVDSDGKIYTADYAGNNLQVHCS